MEGFTLDYTEGQDDEPDTYQFTVAVSHERVPDILARAWSLLPDEVVPVVDVGSRDAYRAFDVYVGRDDVAKKTFLAGWTEYETFLLEDGVIGAGANAEEPFVEVFLDQFKRIIIHVPLPMRAEVDEMLDSFGLEEVALTWPDQPPPDDLESIDPVDIRPILHIEDEFSPDLDELLLQLRDVWLLELNVDRSTNVDSAGRPLGLTLWFAIAILTSVDDHEEFGAYASIWATAGSIDEMEQLMHQALQPYDQWTFETMYMIDRVAYDERPDELGDLPPRRETPAVHLFTIDPWEIGSSPGMM